MGTQVASGLLFLASALLHLKSKRRLRHPRAKTSEIPSLSERIRTEYAQFVVHPKHLDAVKQFIYKVNAAERVLALFEQNCEALLDFTGEHGNSTVLHISSGTGAFTMALSECFQQVWGVETRWELHQVASEILTKGRKQLESTQQAPATAIQLDDLDTKQERITFLHTNSYKDLTDPSSIPEQQRRDAALYTVLNEQDWHATEASERAAILHYLPAAVKARGVCLILAPESCYGQQDSVSQSSDDGSSGMHAAMEAAGMSVVCSEYVPLLQAGCKEGVYEVQMLLATVWQRKV